MGQVFREDVARRLVSRVCQFNLFRYAFPLKIIIRWEETGIISDQAFKERVVLLFDIFKAEMDQPLVGSRKNVAKPYSMTILLVERGTRKGRKEKKLAQDALLHQIDVSRASLPEIVH